MRTGDVVWRAPEEIVHLGFKRSRVVMVNEAHSGHLRCIRTREIGLRILPVAHESGIRHLAMEALAPASFAKQANSTREVPEMEGGYLSQPEMRALIQHALELGWMLIPYEAEVHDQPPDPTDAEFINWREEEQARNLLNALSDLPGDARLLVWSGNSHHGKRSSGGWEPMGYKFCQISSIDPFVMDQIPTVAFPEQATDSRHWVGKYREELEAKGGTAGFLREEGPRAFRVRDWADAFLFSIENDLE